MGYRSDCYLYISAEEKVRALLTGLPTFLRDACEDGWTENKQFAFSWYCKMYPSYPEVAEFYSWLDLLDVAHFHYFEFGEDVDDITDRGELSVDFSYHLVVELDTPTLYENPQNLAYEVPVAS